MVALCTPGWVGSISAQQCHDSYLSHLLLAVLSTDGSAHALACLGVKLLKGLAVLLQEISREVGGQGSRVERGIIEIRQRCQNLWGNPGI